MNACLKRQPIESQRQVLRRFGLFAFGLTVLAVAWFLTRPPVIYYVACWNLGNPGCAALIDRALVERHPELSRRRDESDVQGGRRDWSTTGSFDTGRRKTAIAVEKGEMYTSVAQKWRIFDDRLDEIASIQCPYSAPHAPDDRDNNGTIEILWQGFGFAPVTAGNRHDSAVVTLGRERHSLIAVIRDERATPTPASWALPMWTNSEGDAMHELECIDYTAAPGGTLTPTSIFKLSWLKPGQMAVDGAIPASYKVWLAESADQVTFSPDEDLQSVIERVLKDP